MQLSRKQTILIVTLSGVAVLLLVGLLLLLYRFKKSEPITKEPSVPLFSDDPIDVIGCVFQTYWMVSRGDNLFLIDQHAAHERQLYDELTSRKTELSSQQLLVPREVVLIFPRAAINLSGMLK